MAVSFSRSRGRVTTETKPGVPKTNPGIGPTSDPGVVDPTVHNDDELEADYPEAVQYIRQAVDEHGEQ